MKMDKSDWVLCFFLLPLVAIGLVSLCTHLFDDSVSLHEAYVNAQRVPELEKQICELRGGVMEEAFLSLPSRCYVPVKEYTTTAKWFDGGVAK